MLARLTRLLIVLLACILPLQSVAYAAMPIACAPEQVRQAAIAAEAGHAHGAHTHEHAAPQPDGAAHDHTGDGHLCCHQIPPGAPFVQIFPVQDDFRTYVLSVTLASPLHIPELPQRPPRS